MQLIIAVLVAVLMYSIQYKLYRQFWDNKLNISVRFQNPYMNSGERNYLTEIVSNEKKLPLPVLHVKYSTSRTFLFDDYENTSVTDLYHRNDVFSVLGNQKVTRTLSFVATKRGFYTMNNQNIIAKDFFMTKTFAKTIKDYSELYVFPRKYDGARMELFCNWLFGDIESKKSLYEDPFSFRGVRDYNYHDSMNKVNWKASARTGRLMVNQYNHASEYKVKIMLNLDTNNMIKMEKMQEVCIEIASSLAKNMLEKNISVMFESNGLDIVNKDMVSVPGGASSAHMITIDKALSRIDKTGDIEDFLELMDDDVTHIKDNITYVFVSSYYKNDILLKIDYMIDKGASVMMIVPYFDKIGFSPIRPYMYGWEVKMDEG